MASPEDAHTFAFRQGRKGLVDTRWESSVAGPVQQEGGHGALRRGRSRHAEQSIKPGSASPIALVVLPPAE